MTSIYRGIRFTIVLTILLLAIVGSAVIVSADDNQTSETGSLSIPTQIVVTEPTFSPTDTPTATPTSTPTITVLPTDTPTLTPTDVVPQENDNATVPSSGPGTQTTASPTPSPSPTFIVEPGDNATDVMVSLDSGNNTSELQETNDISAGLNLTQSLPTGITSPYDSLVDPPLNTSGSNIFYDAVGKDWVINQSGEYYLDLSTFNNSGSGVQFDGSTNTFSNFGSGFGILINASNVIIDGMGAVLNGGGTTQYGIIVNNQTAANYNTFSSDSGNALGGISITNITLTRFTQAGILFNNVIGNLPGTIASNITSNGAPAGDVNAHDNSGNGIVLQNSKNIEVSNNIVKNNGGSGFDLRSSDSNTLTNNTATGNSFGGIYLESSNNNNLNSNTATGNQIGIYLYQSGNNNLAGNNASVNWGNENIYIESSSNNNLAGNNASGNFDPLYYSDGILMHNSSRNTLTGNMVSGNNDHGISLYYHSNDNTIYNNYFNNTNNAMVTSDSTGNAWSITPTSGTNIIGGPNLGGNYWATPTGTGWSQTHPDIGGGFAVPFSIPGFSLNIDEHPLVTYIPPPTPAPGPNGGVPIIPSPTPPVLPQAYDASNIESTIPDSMKAGTNLVISITVHNNGTVQWDSGTGVALDALPADAPLFGPQKMYLPEGVTVGPGKDYTFTFTITAPLKPGTYVLDYQMSRNGFIPPGDLKFGDIYSKTIVVTGNSVTTSAVSGYQTVMFPKSATTDALLTGSQPASSSDLVKSQAGLGTPNTIVFKNVQFAPF